MISSRDQILRRLHTIQPEFGSIEAVGEHLPVVPMADRSHQELLTHFVDQARSLESVVHLPASQGEAIQVILGLLGEERRLLSWAYEHIPLPGLEGAFLKHDIQIITGRDPSVQIGLTGADAALAATGSLVLFTGPGKSRLASLLPPVHIAVINQKQLLADLETWVASLRQEGLDSFQEAASAMIISGPSRTADIAMQLTLGMHGPRQLHIIILT